MRVAIRAACAVVGVWVAACTDNGERVLDSERSAAVAADATYLSISVRLEPGAPCTYGGQRTDTGVDVNQSGTLESSEVRSSNVVCSERVAAAGSTSSTAAPSAANDTLSPCSEIAPDAPPPIKAFRISVDGPGYLVLDSDAAGRAHFYARRTHFYVDHSGALTNERGLYLLGYPADEAGVLGDQLDRFEVGAQALAARATRTVSVAVNLDATSDIAQGWSASTPAASSNFSTTANVFDSLGNSHQLTLYFAKTAANAWEYHAMANGRELLGGTPDVPFEGAAGSITFTTDGALDSENDATATWDFTGATPGQAVRFDFGSSVSEGGAGLDGSTSFAAASTTNSLHQDGFFAGTLATLSVDNVGVISAMYSNGQQRGIGNLALARFPVSATLDVVCGDLRMDATEQSEAVLGMPGTAGHGLVSMVTFE